MTCDDAGWLQARKHVLDDLNKAGKAARLRGFERISAVWLDSEPFSVDNDLVSDLPWACMGLTACGDCGAESRTVSWPQMHAGLLHCRLSNPALQLALIQRVTGSTAGFTCALCRR